MNSSSAANGYDMDSPNDNIPRRLCFISDLDPKTGWMVIHCGKNTYY